MKRRIDSEIFRGTWFRKLEPRLKVLWFYVISECEPCGVLKMDWELASFVVGQEVGPNDVGAMEGNMELMEGGKVFIPKFLEFQFGYLKDNESRLKTPLYANIIRSVKKHGLMERLGLSEPVEVNTKKVWSNREIEEMRLGGVKIAPAEWAMLKETFRGVDFAPIVAAAIEANKAEKIVNPARWLADRAMEAKGKAGKLARPEEERYSLDDCRNAAAGIGMTDKQIEVFYTHYAAVGFVDGVGRKIVSLKHALAKWKAKQPPEDKPAKTEAEWKQWEEEHRRKLQSGEIK